MADETKTRRQAAEDIVDRMPEDREGQVAVLEAWIGEIVKEMGNSMRDTIRQSQVLISDNRSLIQHNNKLLTQLAQLEKANRKLYRALARRNGT